MIKHTNIFQCGDLLIVSDVETYPNVFASFYKDLFRKVRKGVSITWESFTILNRFGTLHTFLPGEDDQFRVQRSQFGKGLLHHRQEFFLLT
jgi:hypothetical protein